MTRCAGRLLLGAAVAAAFAGCSLGPDRGRQVEPVGAPAGRCAPVQRAVVHVVRRGETLSGIAQCYRASWRRIARDNGIAKPYRIRVGQKLRINPKGAAAGRGRKDAAPAAAARPPPTRQASGIAWRWPVTGKLVRKFSARGSGKQGIAIAGELGRRVVATAAGQVAYSGEGLVGYGKLIIIQHRGDFLSAYGHNDRLLVREGERVRAGQEIARMGRTAARRPQLHFEIRHRGRPVDPLRYLPRR